MRNRSGQNHSDRVSEKRLGEESVRSAILSSSTKAKPEQGHYYDP